MRLEIFQLVDRHINSPALIAGHGPSLSRHVEQIESMQKENELIRFSMNDWFKIFNSAPNYWVLANTIDTVGRYVQVMNQCKSTVLFADTVDLTDDEFTNQNLQCDYFPYDQRHFKGHTCAQIWHNFSNHVVGLPLFKNYNFSYYGNNSIMWQPGVATPQTPPIRWYRPENISAAMNCCCRIQDKAVVQSEAAQLHSQWQENPYKKADMSFLPTLGTRLTIQEYLQRISGHNAHYSPGDTVILHAIAAAIIMGCNPIYVAGMDLDYSVGYADGSQTPADDGWQKESTNLINDLRILNESAKERNIRIINLKEDAWYGVFETGDLGK